MQVLLICCEVAAESITDANKTNAQVVFGTSMVSNEQIITKPTSNGILESR